MENMKARHEYPPNAGKLGKWGALVTLHQNQFGGKGMALLPKYAMTYPHECNEYPQRKHAGKENISC